MEFGKQGSWDSSSDEYEPQEQARDDIDDPTKRPYECTFCKRGFTNAQALGGHMNIHRKDRAKAKQRIHSSSSHSNAHSNDQLENSSNYFSPTSTQPTPAYYPAPTYKAAHRNNYRMYFEPAAAANYPIHQPRSQSSLSMNEELLGANLSLQIDQTRGVWKNDEVDLELRLGHEYR